MPSFKPGREAVASVFKAMLLGSPISTTAETVDFANLLKSGNTPEALRLAEELRRDPMLVSIPKFGRRSFWHESFTSLPIQGGMQE